MRQEIAQRMGSKPLLESAEVEELTQSYHLYNSAVHPDTKEVIPLYFRMSGFMLLNTPILFGMLLCPQTTVNIAFFQFVNQTYNAGLNYGNRNASSPYSNYDLLKGYGGSVITSCGLALALSRMFKPLTSKLTGPKKMFIATFFNWLAVCSASSANILLMRNKEISQGVSVTDKDGHEYG